MNSFYIVYDPFLRSSSLIKLYLCAFKSCIKNCISIPLMLKPTVPIPQSVHTAEKMINNKRLMLVYTELFKKKLQYQTAVQKNKP